MYRFEHKAMGGWYLSKAPHASQKELDAAHDTTYAYWSTTEKIHVPFWAKKSRPGAAVFSLHEWHGMQLAKSHQELETQKVQLEALGERCKALETLVQCEANEEQRQKIEDAIQMLTFQSQEMDAHPGKLEKQRQNSQTRTASGWMNRAIEIIGSIKLRRWDWVDYYVAKYSTIESIKGPLQNWITKNQLTQSAGK